MLQLLLTSLLLTHTCGCGETQKIERPSPSHRPGETIVTVDPESMDFGLVREMDGPVRRRFTIVNHTNTPLTGARVVSGCGCTVPVLAETTVGPKQRVVVPVTFNPARRLGQFATAVRVEFETPKTSITVPVVATVVRDLWVRGGTVRCTVPAAASEISGTFEVCTADWPQVHFDVSHLPSGLELHELSRRTEEQLTVITFRFVIAAPKDQSIIAQNIHLKAAGLPLKPLMIPIVAYRPLQADATSSSRGRFFPQRIALGTVPPGARRTFGIYGDAAVLREMGLSKLDGAPRGMSIELAAYQNSPLPRRPLTICVDRTAATGFFQIRVCLTSSQGSHSSITVLGAVGSNAP